jgi:hypothetical protein
MYEDLSDESGAFVAMWMFGAIGFFVLGMLGAILEMILKNL